MTIDTTHRICSFCEATCGLELEVDREARKLVGVRGFKDDVLSNGYLCPKAVALKDLDEDPDRLRQPLVRRGGNLEPASWDEAFAEVKRRIRPIIADHGNNAVGIYTGNPTAHKPALSLGLGALTRAIGTTQMYSASTLDQMPRHVAAGLTYGSWTSVPVPDIDRSDLIVVVGSNPLVSNGSMWTVPDFRGRHRKLKARGGRMIVIDPKRTQTARAADVHLTIRPGTDVFFFLGIIAVLFDEGLVAPAHLSRYLENMDLLEEAARAWLPEETASMTGLVPKDVRSVARELARTDRSALYARIGTSVTEYGASANWAVEVINLLCGNVDREGGLMFPKAPAFQFNSGPGHEAKGGEGKGVRWGRRHSRVRGEPERMGEFPAVCLAEEIETPGEGQIRALFTTAGNPVLSSPDGARLARALDTLDFMVSTDIYLNETTRHADVIFPGQSPLEDIHFPIPFQGMAARNSARFSPPVFPLEEGRPAEWEIMYQLGLIISGQDEEMTIEDYDDMVIGIQVKSALHTHEALEGMSSEDILEALGARRGPERQIDLALRTGPYGDFFGRKSDGLSLDKLIANPQGIDLGALQPRLPGVLSTPGAKINLLPEQIARDLPRLKAGLRTAMSSREKGELLLVGRRNTRTNNSWMHNLPTLAKGKFKGALEMNPADADPRGLASGDTAIVENDGGRLEVEVDVTEDMAPGTVSLPHGFGHALDNTNLSVAAKNPGVNSNQLASTKRIDPLSGTAHLNAIEVEVRGI